MRRTVAVLAGLGALAVAQAAGSDLPPIEEAAALFEDSARQIHRSVLTIDTHVDIPPYYATDRADPSVDGPMQVDLPKMREGGLDAVFFSVYVAQGPLTPEGYAEARAAALEKFAAIERQSDQFGDQIERANSADDVERIIGAGKLAAMIGIENGYVMGDDLSNIADYYARGARYMSLTHAGHNQLADSATPLGELGEEAAPLYGGLSGLGKAAVAEMNRLGIMVDVSHSSDEATIQAAELSAAPVIASHSGVQGVYNVPRNLSDAALEAIAAGGGVAQIVAYSTYLKEPAPEWLDARKAIAEELGLTSREAFRDASLETIATLRARIRTLDAKWPRASVADLADHIDYAVKLVGIDHVGIASDFGGGGGVIGWDDASETANVTLELVKRGYNRADIAKLWGGNLLRVWRAVEQKAADAL